MEKSKAFVIICRSRAIETFYLFNNAIKSGFVPVILPLQSGRCWI